MTDEQWSSVLDVTLTGTMRMTRAALRHMCARGAGAIVNNASVVGWRAQAGQSHYAAAKAGVMALTRCAAIEAAPHGVRVNAVAPSLAMHPHPREGHDRRAARRARHAGGVRPRRRAVGGRERDRLPRQRPRVVHDRRSPLGQQPAPLTSANRRPSTALPPVFGRRLARRGRLQGASRPSSSAPGIEPGGSRRRAASFAARRSSVFTGVGTPWRPPSSTISPFR